MYPPAADNQKNCWQPRDAPPLRQTLVTRAIAAAAAKYFPREPKLDLRNREPLSINPTTALQVTTVRLGKGERIRGIRSTETKSGSKKPETTPRRPHVPFGGAVAKTTEQSIQSPRSNVKRRVFRASPQPVTQQAAKAGRNAAPAVTPGFGSRPFRRDSCNRFDRYIFQRRRPPTAAIALFRGSEP